MIRHSQKHCDRRDGNAAVELAILLPLFLTLVMGTLEMGQALHSSTVLMSSLREAGRLAAMDFSKIEMHGQTPNEKVESDIRNFLAASRMPTDDLTLSIVSAEGADEGQTFDFSDPANKNRLFRITAKIPYSSISVFPLDYMADETVKASLVFRLSRVALSN